MVDESFDQRLSAVDIFVTDMCLVTHAARELNLRRILATAAERLYLDGRRAGLGRLDDSSIIELLRARVG